MIEFFAPCVPPTVSHHAKKVSTRGGFARMYDSPELVNARGMLTALFMPHRPSEPLDGPLRLSITLTFPYTTKHKKQQAAGTVIHHSVKPDADNAAKGITDCLASLGFITNDSRVCDLRVRKFYGPTPGIGIIIKSAEAPVGA